MRHSPQTLLIALFITIAVPAIGYVSFGFLPASLFLIGYMSGMIFWLCIETKAPFSAIKTLYWVTFFLFIVHRIEEKKSGFFMKLSEMTGVPIPEITSAPIIILLIISVGAWLLGPFLYSRGHEIGKYLVWTFFASMGVTELAHFVLPLFVVGPYGYFPGMLSVLALAPVSWIAMWKMSHKRSLVPEFIS